MDIRVLGPVEVELGRRPLRLGGPKQRALLSVLALNANATVSVDRLIEGLWGEELPASAAKMVQLYVSQLRKLLEEDDGSEILTHGRGYELRLDPEAVDAARFERLVADASRARGDGGAGEAARGALALWRGPPFADLADEPFAAAEARRLEELHLVALELAIESDLEAGSHGQLTGRLEALVGEHPLRERLHGLRMLALYRAGRQAEALDAYHAARGTLVEQIGVEPGPELRRLHEAILRQDPELDLDVPTADWARRETVERVGEGAERAAARRGELRELEAGLASDVVDLHELRERAELDPATPGREPHAGDEAGTPVCPFKGLASFDVADADYFFGRERLVAEIVARLVGTTLLGVVGPSGSGKSSTMRAGVLPALASGVLPGSEAWTRVLLRPGENPLSNLRRALGAADESDDPISAALSRLQAEAKLLLAVDQFEETFAACRDELERAAFIDALTDAARRSDGRVVIVLALRADYYGACASHPRLSRLLGDNQVLVGPMQPDELARAIEGPARKAGLVVEPELVERLVEDVAGEAGGLPLLSTALLELWQRREGRRMRLAAYERTGGVQGAVARLAEQAYGTLTSDEQVVARRMLLRLAGSGEGDGVVRRRVSLDELEAARDEQAGRVLEVLTDSRLVTVGEGTAEVAHEALLREWPRLRGWLEEDAEGRRLHRHVTDAARDWDTGGRDAGELYRGARLASSLDWAAEHGDELNRLEREFLQDSRLVSEREAARGRQVNRRLRMLLAGGAVALAVAVAAGILAIDQRGDARDAAVAADAQRLGAEALNEDRLDEALRLARAGVAVDESAATRSSLLSVLLRDPAKLGVLHGVDGAPLFALAVSPDERLLAVGSDRGTVTVFDTAARRPLGEPYRLRDDGFIQQVRFSPDGRTLAVASEARHKDDRPGARVDLIDSRTRERRLRVELPPMPGAGPADIVFADVMFLPNGRGLVVLQGLYSDSGEAASVLRHVDGRTGAFASRTLRVGRHPSGQLFATGDRRRLFASNQAGNETWEIDAERLRVLRRYPYPTADAAGNVSPDGRTFALGSAEGRVRLLDLRSGAVRRLRGRHDGEVNRMVFTRDGRTLATSGGDGKVIAWDLPAGNIRETFSGHDAEVSGLEVSADGGTLYSASDDTSAMLWDLLGERRLARPFEAGKPFIPDDGDEYPKGLSVTPDGRTLAVSQSDGTVDLIDTRTLQRRRSLRALRGFATVVDFSPDGRLLAVTGKDGQVSLWNARTLRPAGELKGLRRTSQALTFSPDGKRIAATEIVGETALLRVWDVRRRALTGLRIRMQSPSIAFSPDGRLLAAAVFDRGFQVRDARSGRLVARLATDDLERSVAFAPDGDLLATGNYNGTVQLWSTDSWQPLGPPLEGHEGRVLSLGFSPDGRTLASSSEDGTVLLRDVDTQKPVGSALTVNPDTYVSAAFTPDGSLFAVSNGDRAVRFETSPEAWKRQACLIAGHDLTPREWTEVLPDRPYRTVCRRR
jgi:WD40 repeat protein/DNA-binding SARP family transcriptional activator